MNFFGVLKIHRGNNLSSQLTLLFTGTKSWRCFVRRLMKTIYPCKNISPFLNFRSHDFFS